jgi:hypothetical protein
MSMPNSPHTELLDASEEERRLYSELRDTYERLSTLARSHPDASIATEVARSEALLQRARGLAAQVGPARSRIADAPPDPGIEQLRRVWADSAASLVEILRLREQVLAGLRHAMEETRRSLVRVGLGRSALARYRSVDGDGGARRRQSRRA